MKEIKLIIKIPEEIRLALINNIQLSLDQQSICDSCIKQAIINGTSLPKEHGRLIDADAFERRCMFDSDIEDMQDVIYALRDYKSIIEADKEGD